MKKINIRKISIIVFLASSIMSCKYEKEEYQAAVDQAYSEGFQIGEPSGFTEGYTKGETDGYNLGYAQGVRDGAPPEYNQGYSDGYAAGDNQDVYNSGYAAGEISGYNKGYDDGYEDGDTDGFKDGYDEGLEDSYWIGYADGLLVGTADGYDVGYDDGVIDGYDTGYDDGNSIGYGDGYDDGHSDGYVVGRDDGYDIGINDGYDSGFDLGYNDGYDDGWFAAGGSSSKGQAQALLGTFLSDLIDFGKLKSPKQVLSDPKNQKLLLSSTAGMTVDTKKKKAILNKYIVGAMKSQLVSKYGLSESRSAQIAKLANHVIKASNAGEVNMASINTFSKKVLGADFKEMQDAYKSSLTGSVTKLNDLVANAAEINDITPAHTLKIMGQLFL